MTIFYDCTVQFLKYLKVNGVQTLAAEHLITGGCNPAFFLCAFSLAAILRLAYSQV